VTHDEAVSTMATERYMLGELSAEDRDAFEAHYFDCEVCAYGVKACQDLIEALIVAAESEGCHVVQSTTSQRRISMSALPVEDEPEEGDEKEEKPEQPGDGDEGSKD